MHQQVPEELLIQRAIENEPSAFVQLYDKYMNGIYRHVLYRVGSVAEAEDITQEVFIRAWKSIGRYKHTGARFYNWLLVIAHNLIVDHYKKKGKQKVVTLAEEEEKIIERTFTGEDPKQNEVSYEQELLEQAISLLKGDKQRVIVMHFIDGFSYTEIAQAMNKKEGAVRVMQYRALKELRDIMDSLNDENGK